MPDKSVTQTIQVFDFLTTVLREFPEAQSVDLVVAASAFHELMRKKAGFSGFTQEQIDAMSVRGTEIGEALLSRWKEKFSL